MFAPGHVRAVRLGLTFTSVLGVAAAAEAEAAEKPRATYRWVDPSLVQVAEPQTHLSNVIFLNRCAGGCTLGPGREDSRTDSSSLLSQTVNIESFAHGDEAWDAIVTCVRSMYEPFGVAVTDVDPGATPHFEAIVAGRPDDIGASGIGGMSPFACGVIDNAISYSFANIHGSVEDICATVAQETAHAFGLEHEYLCGDPMSYLTGCGPRAFRDADAPCGELAPRSCECGGETQNSYRKLMSEFAAPEPTPPDVPADEEPGGCRAAGGADGALAMVFLAGFLLCRRRRSSKEVV